MTFRIKSFASVQLFLVLSLVLSIIRIWLIYGQTMLVPYFPHDDILFLTLSRFLLNGDWLGPYNNLTLVKGPFYPIWIAATTLSGISLLIAQHLLYILACCIFALSLRPVIQRPVMIFTIFAFLLFNPVSFTDDIMKNRVLREGIYPALTLLVISGAIGLMARHDRPLKQLAIWSTGLGLALSAFWLTREEGIWIILPVLVIMGSGVIKIYRAKPANLIARLVLYVLPFIILLTATSTIAAINKAYYGTFLTVDVKSASYRDASGALMRVKHLNWKPRLPVPRETRERIYTVSPSFRELRPYLEGDLGIGWMQSSCKGAYICDDIAGCWFMWAVRDAVALAGYYESPVLADNYYKRLALETNAACDEKKLDCWPARSSAFPPWHTEYNLPFIRSIGEAAVYVAAFSEVNAARAESSGLSGMAKLKINLLNIISSGYKLVTPWLAVLALVFFAVSIFNCFRKRLFSNCFIITTAILIAVLARLFIISVMQISLCPSISVSYLSPVYPLMLVFITFSLMCSERLQTVA